MIECDLKSVAIAYALIYLTFFLDNVLLTVLVPIIPDWIRGGESLELWSRRRAPLATLLNSTVNRATGGGGSGGGDDTHDGEGMSSGEAQAAVGAVLSAKALCQLAVSPLAARAVWRRGPAPVLHVATGALALAAIMFAWCGRCLGWHAVACAGVGRAMHGAGSALAGVSGVALVSAALHSPQRDRALAALLGAVALGVLVGYPLGGAGDARSGGWLSPGLPFMLLGLTLIVDLVMQVMFMKNKQFYTRGASEPSGAGWASAGTRPAGACAGAVLCTTCVMAALEPCLPLWIKQKFHSGRWETGTAFLPDSAGYLVGTACAGSLVSRVGAERVALSGQVAVAVAALCVPHARSVAWLAGPHAALGCGLGALDAAVVPALVSRAPHHASRVAALLQVASSGAYAAGPAVAGLLASTVGFETVMRSFGVLNLLYAWYLYTVLCEHPLSAQYGTDNVAGDPDADEEHVASDN